MKKIMFVGTASSVGKSLISAGVGRILMQDGHAVVPFKSQNMSRNSTILGNGLEIATAQRLQAEACGLEPDVRMGPVLLKPRSDNGSELLVHGKPRGTYTARQYYELKDELLEEVLKAYHSLAEDYEVCVIEGAGGVAEINLRDKDIVNLGLAEALEAPVILIGDIDRGGVFASIYGSVALLSEEDRARIKGFIINKFRGDVTLLDSGIQQLEELLNIPCMGVIPYREFGLEEEDSLNIRDHKSEAAIQAGVLQLPTMTNFNDFHPLEQDARISLIYIKEPSQLEDLDLVLIPGSTDLLRDLNFLKEKGFVESLQRKNNKQMIIALGQGISLLGEEILKEKGPGLLELSTNESQTRERRRVNTSQEVLLMGRARTIPLEGALNLEVELSRDEWMLSDEEGRVLGTSLHGVFFNEAFKEEILGALYEKKGLDLPVFEGRIKEEGYNELADHLRKYLDMELLYKVLE